MDRPDPREAFGPEWLAHRFDESRNEIRFVDYDRATRASVPFLIDRYLPPKDYRSLSRNQARSAAPATSPVHFIFHSGFCCSTLLARCFDQPSLATSFSEPTILNDANGWRIRGASPADVGRLLDDALGLLARPFAGDQAAILKPSTVVNGLASAMMRLRPDARAVLMYAPLRDFLTSIAKKSLDGRLWVRELFIAMRREGLVAELGFTDEQFFGQTDLQIAALGWLGQQRLFARLIGANPGRVRSLDAEAFLGRPGDAFDRAAVLYGLTVSREVRADALRALSVNSKDGAAYGSELREAEYRAARESYGDEIEKVAVWAAAVADAAGVALEPGGPLL